MRGRTHSVFVTGQTEALRVDMSTNSISYCRRSEYNAWVLAPVAAALQSLAARAGDVQRHTPSPVSGASETAAVQPRNNLLCKIRVKAQPGQTHAQVIGFQSKQFE